LPTVEGEILMGEMRDAWKEEQRPDGVPPPEHFFVGSNVVLSPVTLQNPGLIKVRAFCGEEVVRLGALLVQRAPLLATPPEASMATTR
jgi:hypothetical protein